MPTEYLVTVSSLGTTNVIAIPKPIRDGFGIEKGDKLKMIVTDDGIYIPLKVKRPSDDLKALQKWK